MEQESIEEAQGVLTQAEAQAKEAAALYLVNQAKALISRQGLRIREYRGHADYSIDKVAELTGLHPNTVGRIERGQREAGIEHLLNIAGVLGVHPSLLMHYAGDPDAAGMDQPAVRNALRAVEAGPSVHVPHFALRASAGPGAELFGDIEDVKAMRPFDASFIRGKLGVQHDDLVLLDVSGQSMEPMLHSDDIILVNLRMTDVLTEGVHLIRMDNALLVKKIQRLPGRVLRVISQNPDYQPFEIRGNDDQERDFSIIGRVMWAGVTIA